MSSEYQLSKWSIRFSPDANPEVYERESDRVIATVHGNDDELFSRALLLARAPSLRDVVIACRDVFAAMARYGSVTEKDVAEGMLPAIEAALLNLDDMM